MTQLNLIYNSRDSHDSSILILLLKFCFPKVCRWMRWSSPESPIIWSFKTCKTTFFIQSKRKNLWGYRSLNQKSSWTSIWVFWRKDSLSKLLNSAWVAMINYPKKKLHQLLWTLPMSMINLISSFRLQIFSCWSTTRINQSLTFLKCFRLMVN